MLQFGKYLAIFFFVAVALTVLMIKKQLMLPFTHYTS